MRQRSALHVTSNDQCSVCSMSQWWRIILIHVSADCLRLERENRSFVIRTGDGASRPRTLSLIAYHHLCIVHLHAVTSTIKWQILRHILAVPSTSFLALSHYAW